MILNINSLTIVHKEDLELEVKDNLDQESLFFRICFKNSNKVKVDLISTLFMNKENK
jgi:hypothetical protein